MAPQLLIIVNPAAGKGRNAADAREFERAFRTLGWQAQLAATAASRSAEEIARQACDDAVDGLVVVGGDGTLNEVLNGLRDGNDVRSDAPWIAPTVGGTGSDFARSLAIASDPQTRVAQIRWAATRATDVGRVRFVDHEGQENTRLFLNIAGYGLAGETVRRVQRAARSPGARSLISRLVPTPIVYLAASLGALRSFGGCEVDVQLDGGAKRRMQVLTQAIANGSRFGAGMKIAPDAVPDDGLFDVVTIGGSRGSALSLAPLIYTAKHVQRDNVSVDRAYRVRVTPVSDEKVLLDVDGECLGRLPASFELIPKAIGIRGK